VTWHKISKKYCKSCQIIFLCLAFRAQPSDLKKNLN